MKKVIAFTFVILTCLFLNNVFAQNNSLLTINTYESADKGYNKIIVIENEKKIEEVELIPFYYKDLESNQITINKILLKYRNNGFKIISEVRGSIALASGATIMVTTYILEN